ncbi:MAG: hypothetical protein K6A73_04810 [Bacteroidales bacterium]|nr:hypothetical protein [Bacteroidales bacterium]
MIEIDWNQLKLNGISKEITFEKFCHQVAVAKFGDYGQIIYPYNMTGSEFYLTLHKSLEYEGTIYPAGTEICWQAKFWVNQNDLENTSLVKDRRTELVNGFKNTCVAHPNMVLWIICTPGMVKEDAYNKLKSELAGINPNIGVDHWHKSVFESFFLEDETRFRGIAAFFFGKFKLNKETVTSISRATLDLLKQKFDVDLHTETTFERQLMGMVDANIAVKTLKERLLVLYKRLENYGKKWGKEERKERRKGLFPEKVLHAFEAYESFLLDLGEQVCAISRINDLDAMVGKGFELIKGSYVKFKEIADTLSDAIKADKKIVDNYSFDYYTEDIRVIKDLIYSGSDRRHYSVEYALELRTNSYFPVFAQAGYGKTHFACAVANKLLNDDLPALLITGSRFRPYARPQEALLKLFEVDGRLTFDELIEALDSLAACFPDARMPIIIDGLNESYPCDVLWREDLPLFIRAITNSKHLFLITTCREKTDYIQRIFGHKQFNEVDNCILLKGIEDDNLAETIRKYFTKYKITDAKLINKKIFKNPLLLAIFSKTNEGAHGLIVNEYSLAECMRDYSDRLVENAATDKGNVDRCVCHDLKKGLVEMGRLLWERNTRSINYFDDFRPVFNDKTDKLIDEGLCFQIDLNLDDSEVKFTYDLMAGYHIAKYILSTAKDATELETLLNKPIAFKKLFGNDDGLHTLSEDIIKSLVYLIAKRDHKDLFDLVPEDVALSKVLSNIEFICGNEKGRRSLEKRLEIPLGKELKTAICDLVKEKILVSQSVFGLSSLMPAFKQMSTEELDILFHSKFLGYGEMEDVALCIKKHLFEDLVTNDALIAAFLYSGTFVKERRQQFIRQITNYARNHFDSYLPMAKLALTISDPFIREAVYLSAVGASITRGQRKEVEEARKFLTVDMRDNPTSHIVLLDLLDTLMEYASSHFSIETDKSVLGLSKHDKWPKLKRTWNSSLYDYSFEKFSLRPYSSLPRKSRSSYTSDDLWYMIAQRMFDNGYNDDVYAQREKELSDNMRFWQDPVSKISHKHRDSAQKELVGWLLLNGIIDPEYENTFRTDEVLIDPSYPAFSPLRCLDTHSYLCRDYKNIASWLTTDPLALFDNKLCTELPNLGFKWVLLRGYMSQRSETRDEGSSLYWSVETALNWNALGSHMVEDLVSKHSHMYAFELGWRVLKTTEEDYYDSGLGMPLLNKYEFSEWSNERDSVPNFYFINEEICRELNLVFSLDDLSYYKGKDKVVEIYQSSNSLFYYLRQDVLEEILDKFKVHLDFKVYADKLDLKKSVEDGNCYKDYKRMLTYEDVRNT